MIEKESNCWVRAKAPSARLFKLSTVDQYVPKQWITRAFFFPLAENTHEEVYHHLREGLSRTLARLPILAGRIRRESGQYASIEVEEEAKVYFGVRDHGEEGLPGYARLKEEHFPMRHLAELSAPKILSLPVTEGEVVFTAQANFVEGGIVLVFGIAHLVGDATAWATITRLWAQYTAESLDGKQSEVEELHSDRRQLSEGNLKRQQDPKLWAVCDVAKSPLNLARPVAPKQADSKPALSSWRIWHFSADKLRQLKQDASPTEGWISTNDALFALFWHRSSLYRKLSSHGFETSSCRIPIDVRPRMQPAIVGDFVGNAVSMFAAEAEISELEKDNGLSSVSSLAQKIRQTILDWEVSSFTSWIAEANALPLDKAFHHPSGSVVAPNILLNDHSKLDTCKLNWGFGKVECIRGIDQNYPFPGLAVIISFPVLADGGIEVATVFDNHVNEALEVDALFMKYAEVKLRE